MTAAAGKPDYGGKYTCYTERTREGRGSKIDDDSSTAVVDTQPFAASKDFFFSLRTTERLRT